MQKKSKPRDRGVNITVSTKAHQLMRRRADAAKPRRNLREEVNVINNLPKEL